MEDVEFSPDGRHLVGALRDGAVLVWSTQTGARLARIEGAEARVVWVGFAGDGRVGAASWDGTLRLYDLAQVDRPLAEVEADVQATWRVRLDELIAPRGQAPPSR